MRSNSFRWNLQELSGALGDLGILLPLMVALVLINGLNPTSVLILVGLFYIGCGLYYRVPTPVQPLKAVATIALGSLAFGFAAGILLHHILRLGISRARFGFLEIIKPCRTEEERLELTNYEQRLAE